VTLFTKDVASEVLKLALRIALTTEQYRLWVSLRCYRLHRLSQACYYIARDTTFAEQYGLHLIIHSYFKVWYYFAYASSP